MKSTQEAKDIHMVSDRDSDRIEPRANPSIRLRLLRMCI